MRTHFEKYVVYFFLFNAINYFSVISFIFNMSVYNVYMYVCECVLVVKQVLFAKFCVTNIVGE